MAEMATILSSSLVWTHSSMPTTSKSAPMGTAPPSKPVETPTRPFAKSERRVYCMRTPLTKKKRKSNSILLKLVARRDWQKVLIRASLFPHEVSKKQCMEWYGVEWNLVPLHLACALKPPPQVVAKLLEHHEGTARMTMCRRKQDISVEKPKKVKKKHRRSFAKLIRENDSHSIGLFQGDAGSTLKQSPTKTLSTAPEELSPINRIRPRQLFVGKSARQYTLTPDPLWPEDGMLGDLVHSPEADGRIADNLSFAPSAVVSSRSLDEGSPFSLEESCADDDGLFLADDDDERSIQQYLNQEGAFLQLGLQGNLCVAKLPTEIAVPQKEPSDQPRDHPFDHEDANAIIDSLLDKADEFLPLHIACLYSASASVLRHLLKAYPLGCQVSNSFVGMLPIHMACSGLCVPPPLPPPSSGAKPLQELVLKDDSSSSNTVVESLKVLLEVFPEGRWCASQRSGMTPLDYVKLQMSDGDDKTACLGVLSQEEADTCDQCEPDHWEPTSQKSSLSYRKSETTDSSSTLDESCDVIENISVTGSLDFVPAVIQFENSSAILSIDSAFYNDDVTLVKTPVDAKTPLYLSIIQRDWEECLRVLHEDPGQAQKWQYGVNMDLDVLSSDRQLWKRLPIHDACAYGAPCYILETLISCHPLGLSCPDPYSGALAMHAACRCDTPCYETVALLLKAHPEAAKTHDLHGCLPLHLACMSKSKVTVVQTLVKSHPEAVWTRDNNGKLPIDYARARHMVDKAMIQNDQHMSEQVVSFLESLPTGWTTPKHRRDTFNIISDSEGRTSIMCSHHDLTNKGVVADTFDKSCIIAETEI